MKEKIEPFRIYNFSHPLIGTEVMSLTGDKYNGTLPFAWEITDNHELSDVVLWDGVITIKNEAFANKIIEDVKSKKVLLLIGESITLLKDHPMVKLPDTKDLRVIEVPGWNILPEELISALELCHKKAKNV